MRVRVLEKSFINDRLVDEGEIIEFEGEPGSNLEVLDPPAAKDSKPASAKD